MDRRSIFAKYDNPSSSSSAANTSRRTTFAGPSEKRQFYIGSFISQLAESDPQNQHFSKGEFVELHNLLRKEASTSPILYKLIQSIVDEAVFLDQDALDCMESLDGGDVPIYDDDSIDELRQTLERQKSIERLVKFNRKRIEQLESSSMNNRQQTVSSKSDINKLETLTVYQTMNNEVAEIYRKLTSNDLNNDDKTLLIVNRIVTELQLNFSNYNQWTEQFCDEFNRKMLKDIEQLTFDVLIHNQQINSNSHIPDNDLVRSICQSNRPLKQKMLLLNSMLTELSTQIVQLNHQYSHFNRNRSILNDIRQIKDDLNTIYSSLIASKSSSCDITSISSTSISSTPINCKSFLIADQPTKQHSKQSSLDSALESRLNFLKENFHHFEYASIFGIFHLLKTNLILLQNKIDNNNSVTIQQVR